MEDSTDRVAADSSAASEPKNEAIGRRLRLERQHRHIGLRELAKRLGVSPSLISQIETGKAQPSVSTLYAMVSELNMSLDELFFDTPPAPALPATSATQTVPPPSARLRSVPSPAEGGGPVQRLATRKSLTLDSGVRWERLTPMADPDVEFLDIVYEVDGASSAGAALTVHSGKEYGVVVRGHLGVTIGFDTYQLGPGDSICFDSTTPHRLYNSGAEPVHAIWFIVGRNATH